MDDIFDEPAYPPNEAARILGLPVATLKAWSFGQASGGGRRFQPVIKAADEIRKQLSFANLCELHVLSAIRRNHKIPLPKVRESLDFVQRELGSLRPLLDRDFKTNGIDLFVGQASKLLNVSKQGQQALRGEFEAALARIERNKRGDPIRLYPFSRTAKGADQPRTVVVDPKLAFGRPVISKVAVPTGIVIDRFRAGDSLTELASDYGVAEADIEEALRFEQRLAA